MEGRGWQRASPGSVLGSIAARARSPAEYAIVLRSLVEDQHALSMRCAGLGPQNVQSSAQKLRARCSSRSKA